MCLFKDCLWLNWWDWRGQHRDDLFICSLHAEANGHAQNSHAHTHTQSENQVICHNFALITANDPHISIMTLVTGVWTTWAGSCLHPWWSMMSMSSSVLSENRTSYVSAAHAAVHLSSPAAQLYTCNYSVFVLPARKTVWWVTGAKHMLFFSTPHSEVIYLIAAKIWCLQLPLVMENSPIYASLIKGKCLLSYSDGYSSSLIFFSFVLVLEMTKININSFIHLNHILPSLPPPKTFSLKRRNSTRELI